MSKLDPSTAAFTPQLRLSPAPTTLTRTHAIERPNKRKQLTREQRQAVIELDDLLGRESAQTKLRRLSETHQKALFNPVCKYTSLSTCPDRETCTKTHFEPLIRPYTDPSLGHCSYLNLCYGDPLFARNPSLGADGPSQSRPGPGKECRYLHFHVQAAKELHSVPPPEEGLAVVRADNGVGNEEKSKQWINCDLRSFDYSVLGQFQVIMADPPWDIHMSLPYGTMTDDELRRLPIPSLQPDWGILALWVTGRAMELGRELFAVWGYRRVDELVWVKVNQLQRLIRTGRTGHWLNHTCEHLLVAVKLPASFPRDAPIPWSKPALRGLRRSVDTDVIVAEVRETSRKPDEIYSILDRLSDGRKLELFGRKHNTREGWMTLGNQLGDSQVAEKQVYDAMRGRYPDQPVRYVGA